MARLDHCGIRLPDGVELIYNVGAGGYLILDRGTLIGCVFDSDVAMDPSYVERLVFNARSQPQRLQDSRLWC